MVNNQEWFDREYNREEQVISLRFKKFQGQLIIENYPKLEKLQLLKVNSIDGNSPKFRATKRMHYSRV